jgi:hypothetical protein
MFDQLSAEIVPSLIKGRHNNNNNNNNNNTNNNKAKCIPGGTLRVLAGKKATQPPNASIPSFEKLSLQVRHWKDHFKIYLLFIKKVSIFFK